MFIRYLLCAKHSVLDILHTFLFDFFSNLDFLRTNTEVCMIVWLLVIHHIIWPPRLLISVVDLSVMLEVFCVYTASHSS